MEDIFFSLDTREEALVLPQLYMSDFVHSPREVLQFLWSGWGLFGGKVGRSGRDKGKGTMVDM